MDYSFLALNSSCLQCIRRVPYIALQWGNKRSNPSDLKEKSKRILPFAHIPMYAVLGIEPAYIREKGFKSQYGNFYMFLGMILETSKVQKWSMGSKESAEGQGRP